MGCRQFSILHEDQEKTVGDITSLDDRSSAKAFYFHQTTTFPLSKSSLKTALLSTMNNSLKVIVHFTRPKKHKLFSHVIRKERQVCYTWRIICAKICLR